MRNPSSAEFLESHSSCQDFFHSWKRNAKVSW
jgi:hypothetical protein